MSTSSVEHREIRYDLLCGHSYTVPAEVEEHSDGPESPYGWCGSCCRWQQVTGKVLDEADPDPAPEGD
ncbi:hypothetical protein [Amycolatopsis sp. NPDC004378]